jgi:hypothetical protein
MTRRVCTSIQCIHYTAGAATNPRRSSLRLTSRVPRRPHPRHGAIQLVPADADAADTPGVAAGVAVACDRALQRVVPRNSSVCVVACVAHVLDVHTADVVVTRVPWKAMVRLVVAPAGRSARRAQSAAAFLATTRPEARCRGSVAGHDALRPGHHHCGGTAAQQRERGGKER